MGCWNGTCMISNLHVKAGQDVVVYMLAANKASDNNCYSHTFYDPCPIPFYGKYDDYGAVEECHGIGLNLVIDAIRDQLYEFGQGPNSCHDCEVNKDNFDEAKMFEADHEGRLGIEDDQTWDPDEYQRRELETKNRDEGLSASELKELDRLANKIKKVDTFRAVTHVIIHGDVFKAITEKFYIEDYVGDGKGTCGWNKNYIRTTFQDILNDIPAYIESVKKKQEDLESSDNPALARIMARLDRGNEWNNPNRVIKRMSYMTEGSESRNFSIIEPSEYIEKYIEAKDWDGLAAFVKELMVTSWLQTYMSSTRKHWTKMTGAGSQSDEHLGYQILAEATLDILKEERAGYEDDEDDGE